MADQGTDAGPRDPFAPSRYVGRCRDVRTGEPVDVVVVTEATRTSFAEEPGVVEFQRRDCVLARFVVDELMMALSDAGIRSAIRPVEKAKR